MTDAERYNPQLVHCGVDWIRVTAMGGRKSENLYEAANVLPREATVRGNDRKPWSMAGFNGYKCGGVQCGNRQDEVIVRLSSDFAHEFWKEIYDDADHCTRLDCQATFRVASEVGPLVQRHFAQAKRLHENRRRAPTLSMLSTNNGPSTLYFNRRVSEQFGRIYDKGAESKLDHLKGCIRYEVEYKGSEASRRSAQIRNHQHPDLAAASMAIEFFERKGITLGKAVICCEAT